MSQTVTAVVLAAGAGTRMKSDLAKVLHPIGGRSMIEHALRAVSGAEPDTTVAVVGHGREQVEDHIRAIDPSVVLAHQAHRDGTGGAVRVAVDALPVRPGGTVLVTYGDVPLLQADTVREFIETHHSEVNSVTILTARPADPHGYGRIIRSDDGGVCAIREQKDASESERAIGEVNSGILAVDGGFLGQALQQLSTDNAQGELYLTDVIEIAAAAGRRVGTYLLSDAWQAEGVNDRGQLARLGAELNRRITAEHMAGGVTITDPATTWIDCDVSVGYDTVIEPGTQLRGSTRIGDRARIGPDTTLSDVTAGDDTRVVRTHGSESVIESGAQIGPFSYLRPGTRVAVDAKLGAFVESKNSVIGPEAKVPHLSYIGDADIGPGSNIGAGTIVANFDGVTKARTQVGRYARTGSNNVFVAPVTIGDGAYTGAGTTVRNDVPAGALSVPDAQQRIMEGWVRRKRPGTPSADAAPDTVDTRDPEPKDNDPRG